MRDSESNLDRQCRVCFAYALWNGQDDILKERLYGLTGPEGNHGEGLRVFIFATAKFCKHWFDWTDVKELYYYLDSTPTHSYMKALYKYPQGKYPYAELLEEARRRTVADSEYELEDTGMK